MTVRNNPFQVMTRNSLSPTDTTPVFNPKASPMKLDAQPFKSKTRFVYSISELLSYKQNATPFMLADHIKAAFAERNPVPYKTPMKRGATSRLPKEEEVDEKKIENRMKQIGYGKLTEGYKNYIQFVPMKQRIRGDPVTPDPHQICSKRSWDGQVKKWRRMLHAFDEVTCEEDLVIVRRNLVVINATPNKEKVPKTDPIKRNVERPVLALRGRTLNFDDDDEM